MSNSNVNDLLQQLQGDRLGQIASQLGASPSQTSDAISAAIPMIVGALGKNTQTQQGADDLFGALQRDHMGGASVGGLDLGVTHTSEAFLLLITLLVIQESRQYKKQPS